MLLRQRSTQGSALYVTTTTETRSAMVRAGPPQTAHALPGEQEAAGHGKTKRDGEEEEPGREGAVGAYSQATQEADEERLANGDPVDGERHQKDEKEQRAHHVVRPRREVHLDRLAREPDREHTHGLDGEGEREHAAEEPGMVAVGVDPLVRRADRAVEPDEPEQRDGAGEHRTYAPREQRDGEDDRRDYEGELDPEVGADVVLAHGEHEADRGEREGRGAAERPLQKHRAGDLAAASAVPPGGLVDPHRVAADRRRQDLPSRVGDEVGAHQPREAVVDSTRLE